MTDDENKTPETADLAGAYSEFENAISAELHSMSYIHLKNLGVLAIKAIGNVRGAIYWAQDRFAYPPTMPMRIGGQHENLRYLEDDDDGIFDQDRDFWD